MKNDFPERVLKRIHEEEELLPTSLRLPKSLIDDFKYIAKENNTKSQTLMRETLLEFVTIYKANSTTNLK